MWLAISLDPIILSQSTDAKSILNKNIYLG